MKRDKWEVGPSLPREPMPWRVKCNGDVEMYCRTQTDAILEAVKRCWARWRVKGRTATLKIKRPDGRIRDERTYPRSSDPRGTKG